jgi:excinuclease UvrABC nuclease subunit
VIKDLTLQMKEFSATQDFESALTIRRGIERFTRVITTHSFTDRHFSYNNSTAKLASLQEVLAPYLGDSPLSRIECYDASNSAMQDATVSMTVMTDGLLDNGTVGLKSKSSRDLTSTD